MRQNAKHRRALRFSASLTLAAVALALSACSLLGKGPQPPGIASNMPAAWAEQPLSDAAVTAHDWWRSFNSQELSALIAEALNANPDLVIATERVHQAEAQVRIAGASLFPELGFGAGTSRRETRPDGGSWSASSGSNATLSASYELDLWGRNAAGVRSAQFSLRSTRYDLETVRLTLVAGVASAYFQVLSLRGRLAVARENLVIADRVFAVVDARFRNGAASALDLARQQSAVLGQRAAIPPLELQERQTLFALALLLGRPPEGFNAGFAPRLNGAAPAPALKLTDLLVPRIAPGLPADLLTRRPDLASAEAQLASANANVAVARAALLPGIQLTASAGLASSVLINFLNAPTATVALGASVAQSIFDGGRLRSQVDVAASREREVVENYRKAILAALADVESALASSSRTGAQELLQEQILEQARRALRLAEIRYREGVDDLLTVLDAQRTLFQAEDQLAQIRLARLQASLGLFKALGGGWQIADGARPSLRLSGELR
jgi:NodT family efflux transporter outer membrane factor (OMF) lipoprotein